VPQHDFSLTAADVTQARDWARRIIRAVPLGEPTGGPVLTQVVNEILEGLDQAVLDTPAGRELVKRCSALCWAAGVEACLGAVNLTAEAQRRVITPRRGVAKRRPKA